MVFKKRLAFSLYIVLVNILCLDAANKQDERYMQLNKAVEQGAIAQARELLAAGAPFDNTTLHLAARKGCAAIVEALLANKASVDARGAEYAWGCYDFDPLMSRIYPALHLAARFGHVATVKVLLAGGACIDKKLYENFDCGTALEEAVVARSSQVVQVLIDEYYDVLLRRCPAIAHIETVNLDDQISFSLPDDILNVIATYLSPASIASFRLASKKFCTCARTMFENIAIKRALQLKENLVRRIGLTISNAKEQYPLQEAISQVGRQEVGLMVAEQEEVMCILTTEYANVQGLDANGLLRCMVICNGKPRLQLTI